MRIRRISEATEIRKKDEELKINAKMLARQTDLAREAEVNLMETERLRAALRRIREWPYDVMGDCVYEARKEAEDALKEEK